MVRAWSEPRSKIQSPQEFHRIPIKMLRLQLTRLLASSAVSEADRRLSAGMAAAVRARRLDDALALFAARVKAGPPAPPLPAYNTLLSAAAAARDARAALRIFRALRAAHQPDAFSFAPLVAALARASPPRLAAAEKAAGAAPKGAPVVREACSRRAARGESTDRPAALDCNRCAYWNMQGSCGLGGLKCSAELELCTGCLKGLKKPR